MADDVTRPTEHPRETVGSAEVHGGGDVVVAGVDGSAADEAVTDWAADQADRCGRPLRLVHVVEPGYQLTPYDTLFAELPSLSEQLVAGGRAVVDAAAARARARHPGLDVGTDVRWGPPAAALVDLSTSARWLVVGAPPRRRLERVLLGSVALVVIAHARCPVAVVPTGHVATPPRHVVVGVDGSTGSALAVELGLRAAEPVGGTVTCVAGWSVEVVGGVVVTEPGSTVWDDVEERYRTVVHDVAERLVRAHPDVAVDTVVRSGGAVRAVLDVAEEQDADLVVVGSRGRGGFAGLLLGSVGRRVVEAAPTVVAVAH